MEWCGFWVSLMNDSFHPHCLGCHSGTGGSIISSTCLKTIRPPDWYCLWPWPSVYVSVCSTVLQTVEYSRESVYGIPPPIEGANWMGPSNIGTVSVDILWLSIWRLAPAFPPCRIHVQQYPKFIHSCISILCQLWLPSSLYYHDGHSRIYKPYCRSFDQQVVNDSGRTEVQFTTGIRMV
jgi:hypothetical protein